MDLVSLMKKLNMLRIPEQAEIIGIDLAEIPGSAYPKGILLTRDREKLKVTAQNKIG
ncbi:hypothetical protein [Priestia filamentosa]|uniref:hypothetical protein n=1 Tax=Priestia filamentosa TaxID=1402861 RepID=UPI002E206C8A|nr:hypothetical protein [Priestia filamentosa]